MCAPKNTPTDIVQKLNAAVQAGLVDAKLMARLSDLGAEPIGGSSQAFAKLIADETDKWGTVIRTANIRLE